MAAYAALISLSHSLHHIMHPPPLNKIIIDRELIEYLQSKVDFFIDFLETYSSRSSKRMDDLKMLIADAAYTAENIIESNVVSQIRGADGEGITTNLCEAILEKFLFIEKEVVKMKEMAVGDLRTTSSKKATSLRPLLGGKISMVGFDEHLIRIMSELATDEPNRQIITIVGMGGIGKTTLAACVYNNSFIVEHFDVHAWVTVSQEYTIRGLLLRLLYEINKVDTDEEHRKDDELGLQLHKELFGRRYLIVMDDIWDIGAWEKLQVFLPHNENGTPIMVTTRLSNLNVGFGSGELFKMNFLDESQSWDLLRKKIFAEEVCPIELEEIGKRIAQRCSGLPLALVVIGGLLAMSEKTIEHWESVLVDITFALNYGNDKQLMNTLSLSYIHLPIYLKPCFLYFAIFPEDFEILVSMLVRLCVAEGFIRPSRVRCLEEVAYEYLEELISRNLILVHERGSTGKVKSCKIHDTIRDLCIIQAEKENILHITKLDNPSIPPKTESMRRMTVPSSEPVDITTIQALQAAKFIRSWLSHSESFVFGRASVEPSTRWKVNEIIHNLRLLKVLHLEGHRIPIDVLKLSNLRYVVATSVSFIWSMFLCWNLQTLVVDNQVITLPVEIWQMPQLRHLKIAGMNLPNPPNDENVTVLGNLHTLTIVRNFRCTERVVRRIRNLKKLKIKYHSESSTEQIGYYCLKNLVCFNILESLGVTGAGKLWAAITFPISLKKLTLRNCKISWDDLSIVGSLPYLEVLKLFAYTIVGEEWNPIEGEFCRLKLLFIWGSDLKLWAVENCNFPCLERLILVELVKLEEIPMSFAEILPLQVIELLGTNDTMWASAREISYQRELLGYEPLQLREHNGWQY